ncbi:MAG: response regulator [Myxococcaceae bacterium]|nr:response regulator [Myxococcaceae bacterium]
MLIVDDDADIRRLLKVRLAREHDVVEADCGAAALAAVATHPVDLAIVDMMMPGMTGIDVCRKLKEGESGFLPVILLTALTDQLDRNAGLAAGADEYLAKPIDAVELGLRVRHLLRLREQDRVIQAQLAELKRVAMLKDELTELLVHDMRNPITAMVVALQLLQRELSRPADRELVELGLTAGQRVKDTLCDLLEVTRLERGELSLARARVSVDDLVQDAVRTLRPTARDAGVAVSVVSAEPLHAELDRKLLLRALENLLANAVRHTRQSIDVSLSRAGDLAIIAIADRGGGIPDPLKEGLFEKFGGVELKRAGAVRGFGLGLYMVRLVVQAHGGHVEVDDREGGGTVFRLTLPVASSA